MRASELRARLTESEFQTKIIDLAHARGWLAHHTRPARKRDGSWSTPIEGDPGFPDLVLSRSGRVIFAEVKTENGKLIDAQVEWLSALCGEPWRGNILTHRFAYEHATHEVYVWRPSDMAKIEELLA